SLLPSASQLVELSGPAKDQVLASQSGRVVAMGRSHALGNYIALEDVYGDVFTYAGLGRLASRYHVTSERSGAAPTTALVALRTAGTSAPKASATAGSQSPLTLQAKAGTPKPAGNEQSGSHTEAGGEETAGEGSTSGKVLLYARPGNPDANAVSARLRAANGGYAHGWQSLRVGVVVSQGTVLGTPETSGAAATTAATATTTATATATAATATTTTTTTTAPSAMLRFAIRPAGDTSAINPQPILQNWDQLARALHPEGAKGNSGLVGATAGAAFLLTQSELERAVLADPGIELTACARHEVAGGHINGRVLAMLLFLSRNGLKPTVGDVRCNGTARSPGGVYSAVNRGEGVDISKVNGLPIAEHQGAGTITDLTIRTLLTLQGRFAPHRIVSLMRYPGAPTTQASVDHASFIEVDYLPAAGSMSTRASTAAAHSAGPGATAPSPLAVSLGVRSVGLSASQWSQLVERIATLPQPKVSTKPGSAAIRDPGSVSTSSAKSGKRP
ncbi:MAG: M23 family metallopeptidase, partial [Solirubrobacteraceae bacterium]